MTFRKRNPFSLKLQWAEGGEKNMTTIVNTPAQSDNANGGMGMIIGLIALLVFAYLFIVYGLPAIRQIGSPQINIPNKIDINVKQTK